MSDDDRSRDEGAMSPADVPDELVRAALKAYCVHCSLTVGRQPWSDHEEEARVILAAALSLHVQQLREQLVAANARAEMAETIVARVGTRMAEYDRHGSGMVNVRQVINLLSPTWPDGNYSSGGTTDGQR